MYCTRDDVKQYLRITQPTDDPLIDNAIATAKQAIDNYCATCFDANTDSIRYYGGYSPLIAGRTFHLGRDTLADIPTQVMIDETDVTSSIVVFPPPPYSILILSEGEWNRGGMGIIRVTGKFGYSTNPPASIVQAAIIWASHFYQIKDMTPDGNIQIGTLGTYPVQEIPSPVSYLLEPYRRLF